MKRLAILSLFNGGIALAITLFVLSFPGSLCATTFTVTTVSDSGVGSLRQAILDANTNLGPDVIEFAIGTGVQTITLASQLPDITDPVTVDGTTQPGYAGQPLIVINGNFKKNVCGLVLVAGNSTVRALAFNNIGTSGTGIVIPQVGIILASSSNSVKGCYLGMNAAGTAKLRCQEGGIMISNAAYNIIGGELAGDKNLISGNSGPGVFIAGTGASNNTVLGNVIGLDIAGTNSTVGNTGDGILISNAPNNIIGGSTTAARNIISGNSSENIRLLSPGATGNQIQGNWIGLRPDGLPLTVLYSSYDGIRIDNAPSNTVGGTSVGLRNVLANTQAGLRVVGSNATGNVIQGNFIGTSPSGTLSMSNFNGISIGSRANGNVIGGTAVGAGNLISGNRNYGITVNDSSETIIQGNLIGTDVTGLTALPNGVRGSGAGVNLGTSSQTATNNQIGGPTTAARNIISGNQNDGLVIVGAGASNNVVQGNYIGVAADGQTPMRNVTRGISNLGANNNLFGGAISGARNVIAYNGLDGIWLAATFGAFGVVGTNNLVMGNQIYSNGVSVVTNGGYAAGITLLGANVISSNSIYGNIYAGIDRGGDGPTANVTNGPSNYPVLTSAKQGSTIVDGAFNGRPNCTYHIEFALSPVGDPNPQFKMPLGYIDVATDGAGTAIYHVTFPTTAEPGDMVTATATPYCPTFEMETSEISTGVTVGAAGSGPATSVTYGNSIYSGIIGHPVSTFTGELFDSLPPDISLGGPMPLVFHRYYASFLQRDGKIIGALGDNWLHNFEMKLTATATNVEVVTAQGRVITFTNVAGAFVLTGRRDILFQLATNGGNYVLGDPRSQQMLTFDGNGKLVKIEDGRGNTHTLVYSNSLVASVSDGLGRAFSFQYNGNNQLTNVTDGIRSVAFAQSGSTLASSRSALGFVTTYTYDLVNSRPGLMTMMTEPQGNAPFTQTFDTQGRVLTQLEAGTNLWSLQYNGAVTTVTNPTGSIVQDTHAATGELAGYRDEANQVITIGSNLDGQRTLITDRLGNSIGIAYHSPSGKPAYLTNADGTLTAFGYVARTNNGLVFYDLAQIVYPDGTSESFTFDAQGNMLARADQAGRVWGFSYNAHGQILTATNPMGGVSTYSYGPDGLVATSQDSDTGLTQYFHDSFQRLTNVTHPDGTQIIATYDADNRITSLTDERGNVTHFAYDANNRLIQIMDAAGRTSQFTYDAADRLANAIDRLGAATGIAYDSLRHVAAVTNRNGFVTHFTYDARQRLTTLTDPANQTWNFTYDPEGLARSFINPLNQTNLVGRDTLGYPIGATNALGESGGFVRDALRRVTQVLDGLQRTNGFAYDLRGYKTNATRPLIGGANYQRNELGLLSRITGVIGEQWNLNYTPMGRRQSLTDPLNRTASFTYDNRGRLQRTTFPDGITRSNVYDPASNPTRLSYSSGPDLAFGYDSLNRLISADNLAFDYDAEGRVTNTLSSGVNYGATYDPGGRLVSVSYHGGILTVTYVYDSRDRLTRVSDSLTGTQVDLTYDDAGRLIGITRPNGMNGIYTYDAAGRVTRMQEGAIVDLQYAINPAGEITSANVIAPLDPANFLAPANPAFNYDAAHQVVGSGYAFDARGRQTASPGHNFVWDGASRLVGIDSVTLAYNGANNLLTRSSAGVTTRYYYNHAVRLTPIMVEKNETSGQVERLYVWTPGGRLLYMIDAANGNAVFHFHFDRVGSTLALTSGSGAVTDAYAYSPLGVLLHHSGTNTQPFLFVGAFGVRSEPAANLYHMRARYYDPLAGRFLSRDALWPDLADPDSLNPYSYAARNPLKYIDPLGLSPFVVPDAPGPPGCGRNRGNPFACNITPAPSLLKPPAWPKPWSLVQSAITQTPPQPDLPAAPVTPPPPALQKAGTVATPPPVSCQALKDSFHDAFLRDAHRFSGNVIFRGTLGNLFGGIGPWRWIPKCNDWADWMADWFKKNNWAAQGAKLEKVIYHPDSWSAHVLTRVEFPDGTVNYLDPWRGGAGDSFYDKLEYENQFGQPDDAFIP